MEDVAVLERRRDGIKAALAAIGDMRPGSLYVIRGREPRWMLSCVIDGKRVAKTVPAAALEQTRQEVDGYRRFQALNRELVQVTRQLCEMRECNQPSAKKKEEKRSESALKPK